MPWQFTIDNRAAGPVRENKTNAMRDAVNDGYAVWIDLDEIRLDEQAAISYVERRSASAPSTEEKT